MNGMSGKRTLVLGASPNPSRYSYVATQRIAAAGHPVIPLGIRKGDINGIPIEIAPEAWKDVDTVTMYMGAEKQKQFYDYLLETIKPKRIIFNPGAENPELERLAIAKGIAPVNACTLVMLSIGNY